MSMLAQNVLVVVGFTLLCVLLLRRGHRAKVNEMLFYLVLQAEQIFGSGTGELKYSAVTTWIYEQLPSLLKVLFTSKQIDSMIEGAVDRMKEYLSENAQAKELIEN